MPSGQPRTARSRRGRKSFGRLDIRRRLRPSASSWSGQRCWPPGWRAMNLDLDLAADFLVLVEERHYGRAAARLYLTPPALTKRMQRLERLLGVVILERGPAGVLRLTAAGERFAREAAPLLAHAAWVRDVVRHPPGRYTVRVGYPAGTGVFPGRIPLASIFRDIRREHPEASFACTKVPFTALTDCLPTHAVDVLWTSAPVQHEGVESVPAMADSALIGVVSSRHELAEAGVVAAEAFCAEPMLYNPAVAAEWMHPFYLGDVRPRREAHLVAVDSANQEEVLRTAADGTGVMTTFAMLAPALAP